MTPVRLAVGDTDAALGIVGRDQQLNQPSAEVELEPLCTLTRQAPVACDLRLMAGLLDVNHHLERMAIYAPISPEPSPPSHSNRHQPRSAPL